MMAECREEVEVRWRANLNAVMARVRSWGWVRKAGLMIGASAVLEEEMVMLSLLKVARRPIARVAKSWTPSLGLMAKGALGKDMLAPLVERVDLFQSHFDPRPICGKCCLEVVGGCCADVGP